MIKKLLLLFVLLSCHLQLALSQGKDASTNYYFTDFESLGILGPTFPEQWITNDMGMGFSASFDGIEGSMCISATLTDADERYFITHEINLGKDPIVEFYHMVSGMLGPAAPNCLRITVSLSTDNGSTWKSVDTIIEDNFTGTTEYQRHRTTLADEYANKTCKVKISAYNQLAESVFLSIDNFAMGTPPATLPNNLSVNKQVSFPPFSQLGHEIEATIKVLNNGDSIATGYKIQILDQYNTIVTEIAGTELASQEEKEYTLKWTTSNSGKTSFIANVSYEKDLDTTDNRSDSIFIYIIDNGTPISLGDGEAPNYNQPFGFYDEKNISQDLFTPDELNFTQGDIREIFYEGSFKLDIHTKAEIWMGETDSSNLYAGWISPDDLIKVFEGDLHFQKGDNQHHRIILDSSFKYSGSKNLVIYTYCHNTEPLGYDIDAGFFVGTYSLGLVKSRINAGSDIESINPQGGSPSFNRTNVTFILNSNNSELYDLSFNINDSDGLLIDGTCITLNDSVYETGRTSFTDIPSGKYDYAISKEGYASAFGSFGLLKDTCIDIVLTKIDDIANISGYVHETFENLTPGNKPFRWKGDFAVDSLGGVNDSYRLTQKFWYFDGPRSIETRPIFMGPNPIFSFEYRLMKLENYPQSAATGKNAEWTVSVSTDNKTTWKELKKIDFFTHIENSEYQTFSVDVSDYANEICWFQLSVNRDYGMEEEFYFDIDEWKIGTRRQKDLAVVSPISTQRISSKNKATPIKVTIQNIGLETSSTYKVSLYIDGDLFNTQEGDSLLAETSRIHTFNFLPEFAGEYTIEARLTTEDNDIVNNKTAPFYLSVVDEDISFSSDISGEGEDETICPINFYHTYSLNQSIYFADEIGIKPNECISGISYRTSFSTSIEDKKITVWITETDREDLAQAFVPISSFKKVFEGTLDFSDKEGDNCIIKFQTEYKYNGRNLVICIYREDDTPYFSSNDFYFLGRTTMGIVKNHMILSDDPINLDTLDPETGIATFIYLSTGFLKKENVDFFDVQFNIIDSKQNVIPDATLTFNGVTLEKGIYTINDVPNGTYPYIINYMSETQEGSITVDGANTKKTIIMNNLSNKEDITNKQTISVFPNPTNGIFLVKTTKETRNITLYDIYGKQVCRYNNIGAGTLEVDITNNRSGFYLLMVDEKAFKITKR